MGDRARTTRSTLECDASKGQSEQERKPNSAKAQGCAQRQQCGTCVQALVVEERPNEWGVGTTPSDPASAVELHFGLTAYLKAALHICARFRALHLFTKLSALLACGNGSFNGIGSPKKSQRGPHPSATLNSSKLFFGTRLRTSL